MLRIHPRSDQKTAIQFLDYVLARLSSQVEKIQTDNGAELQSSFYWHVLDQGIGHTYIRPATPRLDGKVERSHRIDAEEFYRLLDGTVIDDAGVFNTKLKEWEDSDNFQRPHGSLGGQTPYERLQIKDPSPAHHRPSSVAHPGRDRGGHGVLCGGLLPRKGAPFRGTVASGSGSGRDDPRAARRQGRLADGDHVLVPPTRPAQSR